MKPSKHNLRDASTNSLQPSCNGDEPPLSDDSKFSAEQFAAKMEAGDFDGRVNDEIRKLSREQLLEVANVSVKLWWANIDQALLKHSE